MAIALYFRRITEPDRPGHPLTVTYEYGTDPDRMDRRLVIDLVADRVRPVDGTYDPLTSTAARRILRLHRETGSWPEKGGHFS